jgi:hypothetical protein
LSLKPNLEIKMQKFNETLPEFANGNLRRGPGSLHVAIKPRAAQESGI